MAKLLQTFNSVERIKFSSPNELENYQMCLADEQAHHCRCWLAQHLPFESRPTSRYESERYSNCPPLWVPIHSELKTCVWSAVQINWMWVLDLFLGHLLPCLSNLKHHHDLIHQLPYACHIWHSHQLCHLPDGTGSTKKPNDNWILDQCWPYLYCHHLPRDHDDQWRSSRSSSPKATYVLHKRTNPRFGKRLSSKIHFNWKYSSPSKLQHSFVASCTYCNSNQNLISPKRAISKMLNSRVPYYLKLFYIHL